MSEHTITENLARLTVARTNIANAIAAKGGTVNSGDGLEEFPADVATISSGGDGSANMSDVNFYDYDGTIVDSYTSIEFAGLDAMPDNPSHDGLTAQGWNWSLSDAKAYVAKYGKLNVGQMYKTDDGTLRIYIHLEEGRLSPVLGLCPKGTLTVDWGDGSTTETMTGSYITTLKYLGHTYASAGDYVIRVLPSAGGKIGFKQRDNQCTILCKSQNDSTSDRRVNLFAIHKIEIPDSVTSIGDYAFYNCYGLSSITMPNTITSIGTYAFQFCHGLTSVTLPDSVTSIGGSAFQYSYGLTTVSIPDSVTSIGGSAFRYCYGFSDITIPGHVSSIGLYTFQNCYNLSSVIIPDSVTSISSYAFETCLNLLSVTIPDSIESIDSSVFSACAKLFTVTIPDNVTNIGNSAFESCTGLPLVTIPNSCTSIAAYAFNKCYGLGGIKFTSTTPPTVANSNAWSYIPTDCIIYVPTGYLEDYEDATNYPDPDVYQYVEY